MPATFDQFGLRFLYPDNWELVIDDEAPEDGVVFQIPGGGFCSILRDNDSQSDSEVIQEIAKAIQADYGEMESEELEIQSFFENGSAAEMRFYYLDLLIVARTLITRMGDDRFILQFQAESRDFDANERVFAAIVKQLRECSMKRDRDP